MLPFENKRQDQTQLTAYNHRTRPAVPSDLPPVPSIPVMYKTPAVPAGLAMSVVPPAGHSDHEQRSGGNTGVRGGPAGPSARSTKGLSMFFRKLTGRGKKEAEPPLPTYTTARHHHHAQYHNNTAAEPVGSASRRMSRRGPPAYPVPQVSAPARVRGVLAEMDASSAAIQRRHTARKSMIKRVPVPNLGASDDEEQEPIADPDDTPAPMDPPVQPESAADARAAALAALEGTPRPRAQPVPPHRTPSPGPMASSVPDTEAPVTPPSEAIEVFQQASVVSSEIEEHEERQARRPLLEVGDAALPEEPILKTAVMASPILTQVVVMEPHDVDSAAAVDAPARTPQMKIVSRRSFSGQPVGPGDLGTFGGSLGRLPKGRKKLSDFAFDKPAADSDDSDDEGADVVRPLQLRIPPRSATLSTVGSSGDALRTPRTPVSMSGDTPTSSSFDHASIAGGHLSSVGHGSTETTSVAATGRNYGSSTGHSIWDSQPTSPVTPLSASSPRDVRFAGSSPPRVAAVGDGISSDSHSRAARFRAAGQSLGRKLSTRPAAPKQPPTSHDACVEKQRQLANRRQSCRPTLHSNASIAAEMREVRNKDDVHTMETFFMS